MASLVPHFFVEPQNENVYFNPNIALTTENIHTCVEILKP